MRYAIIQNGAIVTAFGGSQLGNPNVTPPAGYQEIQDTDPLWVAWQNAQSAAATLQQKLTAGITVDSTSAPSINATYPLDLESLFEITSVVTSLAEGQGLPLGATSLQFHDVNGNVMTIPQANVVPWAKAIRDYYTALKQTAKALQLGQSAAWPVATVTIP